MISGMGRECDALFSGDPGLLSDTARDFLQRHYKASSNQCHMDCYSGWLHLYYYDEYVCSGLSCNDCILSPKHRRFSHEETERFIFGGKPKGKLKLRRLE